MAHGLGLFFTSGIGNGSGPVDFVWFAMVLIDVRPFEVGLRSCAPVRTLSSGYALPLPAIAPSTENRHNASL
jgi:hypothetical protein